MPKEVVMKHTVAIRTVFLIFSTLMSTAVLAAPNDDLAKAVSDGDYERVVQAINAGADPNAFGGSLLFQAVRENQAAIVEYLAQHGADVNRKILGWGTVLSYAVAHQYVESAKALVRNRADVSQEGYRFLTP